MPPKKPANGNRHSKTSSKTRNRSPHKSGSRPGHKQARNPLLTLWEQWLQQPPYTALDRWLRGQMRSMATDERWPAQKITQTMLEGVRYQQLVCVLEDRFIGRMPDSMSAAEWLEWDDSWNSGRLNHLQPLTFWSWIERISGQSWGFARQQKDHELRGKSLQSFAHQARQAPLSACGLLWQGLRPLWADALQQRAQKSGWSQDELQAFCALQNQQPPLWLRTNPLQMPDTASDNGQVTDDYLQQIIHTLRDEEINVSSDHGQLAARGGKNIQGSELYKSGQLEIQDLASQQIAAALDAQPGDKIWDACAGAGAGGKTLALASRMNNKGALVATDLHQYKLNELKRRVKRAGANNVRTFVWDGQQALRLPKEIERQGGFDKVLVDAPCTSSGTWRRNPDARWRFNADDTAELNELQQRLLSLAAQSVKPGGTLVYATCSWAIEENEAIVGQFVQQQGFRLLRQSLHGAPQQDSDTMFVAVLERPL